MYKEYKNYDPFTPFDANSLLRQGRIPVANAGERAQILNPTEGMEVYRLDTHAVEIYTGTAWRIVPRTLGFSIVTNAGDVILAPALTTIANLALAGMPRGAAMLLTVVIDAANGASGGTRYLDVQAMNGASSAGLQRRYVLPLGNPGAVTITHQVVVDTPTSSDWSLKLGCDQASSVLFRQATLTLTHKP